MEARDLFLGFPDRHFCRLRAALERFAQWNLVTVALSVLGVLTAFANYFSALGSKFWQENWENHINMLEDEFEGGLHKTIWLLEGKTMYSVTGINKQLSCFFIVFWFFAVICTSCKFANSASLKVLIIIAAIAGIAIGVFQLLRQRTCLKGKLANGVPFDNCSCWCERVWCKRVESPTFVRCYGPDEKSPQVNVTPEPAA